MNRLYYGDNLDVLRRQMAGGAWLEALGGGSAAAGIEDRRSGATLADEKRIRTT